MIEAYTHVKTNQYLDNSEVTSFVIGSPSTENKISIKK